MTGLFLSTRTKESVDLDNHTLSSFTQSMLEHKSILSNVHRSLDHIDWKYLQIKRTQAEIVLNFIFEKNIAPFKKIGKPHFFSSNFKK